MSITIVPRQQSNLVQRRAGRVKPQARGHQLQDAAPTKKKHEAAIDEYVNCRLVPLMTSSTQLLPELSSQLLKVLDLLVILHGVGSMHIPIACLERSILFVARRRVQKFSLKAH